MGEREVQARVVFASRDSEIIAFFERPLPPKPSHEEGRKEDQTGRSL
jgi:hypothetical protein